MPPIRDYVCDYCNATFEKLVKTDEMKTECLNCGRNEAIAQLSAPKGFVFKGEGFYETDYKRK